MSQDNLSNITGLSSTITLKGNEYKIYPIDIGSLAECEKHFRKLIKEEKKKEFLGAAKEIGMADDDKTKRYMNISDTVIPMSEVEVRLTTMEGTQYLFYLSLKRTNPDITLEKTGELMAVNNLPEIIKALGLPSEGKSGPFEMKTKNQ